jgi:hypothetical protein
MGPCPSLCESLQEIKSHPTRRRREWQKILRGMYLEGQNNIPSRGMIIRPPVIRLVLPAKFISLSPCPIVTALDNRRCMNGAVYVDRLEEGVGVSEVDAGLCHIMMNSLK